MKGFCVRLKSGKIIDLSKYENEFLIFYLGYERSAFMTNDEKIYKFYKFILDKVEEILKENGIDLYDYMNEFSSLKCSKFDIQHEINPDKKDELVKIIKEMQLDNIDIIEVFLYMIDNLK